MIGVATNPNSDNMTSHLTITMMEDDSDIDTTIHSTSTDTTASLTMAMTMTGPAHETLSEEITTPIPAPPDAVSVAMTESKNVPTPTQEQQNVNMNTKMNTNIPDLVAIQSSTCDACPYCNDICLNFESCAACRQKIMDLNLTYHRFISRKNVNVGNGGTSNSGTRTGTRTKNRSGKNHNNTAEEVHVEESSCASWFRNTNAKTNTTAKTYISPCHLRRHNTRQSPWLKCGNDIYDATPFLRGHPGGEACILKKSGGAVDDCTRDMMFHSARAIALWKKYRVGTYRPCCRGSGGCGAGAGASASAEQNDFWNNRHVEDENEESCVIS